MSQDGDDGMLDGLFMRVVGSIVIVACVGVLAYLNRDKLVDRPGAEKAGLNPAFVSCRDERVAQVEKMLADGVIKQDRFDVFKARAIETCAGQFPPE